MNTTQFQRAQWHARKEISHDAHVSQINRGVGYIGGAQTLPRQLQSLKIRLLAMLHIGFVWLGITFVLFGITQFAALRYGQGALLLAPLHALTIGCLGSLIMAMVTRVSCGHSGRTLVADDLVWRLFLLLQVAVVLRLVGAFPGFTALLPLAAAAWFGIVLIWGNRLVQWYGKPRVDGKAG